MVRFDSIVKESISHEGIKECHFFSPFASLPLVVHSLPLFPDRPSRTNNNIQKESCVGLQHKIARLTPESITLSCSWLTLPKIRGQIFFIILAFPRNKNNQCNTKKKSAVGVSA